METEFIIFDVVKITLKFTPCCAEPDVGIMSDYCEDIHITEVNDVPVNKPPKGLYDRIDKEPGLWGKIEKACNEYVRNYQCNDFY